MSKSNGSDRRFWSVCCSVTPLLSTALMLGIPGGAIAASPQKVAFDVASLVECRDVTPPEFAQVNRHEKLVEARLHISALVRSGSSADLTELFYRIASPERTFRMADYFPKTTLASEFAGNVGMEEKSERALTLGMSATGSPNPLATANANLSAADRTANCRRYELLPPLETIAASGTVDRANGVYFKLRPTTRTSIEGSQEFVVILRVPAHWRADYLTVNCQALGRATQISFSSRETQLYGHSSFVVALYMAGDDAAQAATTNFAQAESELRRVSAAQRHQVERRATPTPVHELAVHLAVKTPRIPENWLEQLLVGPDREAIHFLGYLPAVVRECALDYCAARRKLRAINEGASRLPQVD